MKVEEKKLAERASRGDVEAFSKLVRAHSEHVRRVALRVLGNDEADDAAQEAWIRVWANLKGFRGDSAFGTWLHRIVVNTCLDLRRRKARREGREIGESSLPRLQGPPGGDDDPEISALRLEHRQEVRTALEGVRSEHRAAMLLRHVEDFSYSEISGILDVPVGTAKVWASRGRAALLAALSEEERAADRTRPHAPGARQTVKLTGEPSASEARRQAAVPPRASPNGQTRPNAPRSAGG